MVRKTYFAPRKTIMGLTLIVNNKIKTVSFNHLSVFNWQNMNNGSVLVTNDEGIQAALEAHSMFNRDYFIFKEEVTEDAPTPEKAEEKKNEEETPNDGAEVISVSSPADAREYLHKRFGVEMRSVWKKQDLIETAKKYNIVFDGI